jgi:hypothetical protein
VNAIIDKPGLYDDIPTARYHADDLCALPSLSSSILQIILSESPLHAWAAHPRLNMARERDDSRRSEIGSVSHKLAIGKGADIVVLPFDSYRKKEAQEGRDAATMAGKIPILADDYARALALSKPLAEAAEQYLGMRIDECLREQVIVWNEGKFWRRCMIDLARPDLSMLLDLKTTEASVSPISCARRVYDGYDVQAAFYTRGADAVDPAQTGRRTFGLIFAEQQTPFAISPPIEFSEAGIEMARQKVEIGCRKWDSCIATNRWPGYGSDVYIAEPPPWALQAWELRQTSDESLNPLHVPEDFHTKLELLYGRKS